MSVLLKHTFIETPFRKKDHEMAYKNRTNTKTRKTTSSRSRGNAKRNPVRSRSSGKRTASRRSPQTIRLVIEQVAAPQDATQVMPSSTRSAGKAVF